MNTPEKFWEPRPVDMFTDEIGLKNKVEIKINIENTKDEFVAFSRCR